MLNRFIPRFVFVLMLATGFVGSGAIDVKLLHADDSEKLKASHAKWEEIKMTCNGSYSYKVSTSSFSGIGTETEVVVTKNKVTMRRFRTFDLRIDPRKKEKAADEKKYKWVEKGMEIGKHKEGAPPKTLDEIYAVAAKVVERKLEANEKRYVRIGKDGLLRACYSVDTRIADDAPTNGVIISSISINGSEKPGKVYKVPNGKAFPKHWGEPPRIQTRDLRPLPGGYGRGSSTLASWIKKNLANDAKKK